MINTSLLKKLENKEAKLDCVLSLEKKCLPFSAKSTLFGSI